MIFAFFTNEQAYSSAESFQDTINTVVDHGLDFVDDSVAVSVITITISLPIMVPSILLLRKVILCCVSSVALLIC